MPNSAIPSGRIATVWEATEGALWRCSDSASYAVGMAMAADGGLTTGAVHLADDLGVVVR